jgi:hypothetical protein
MKISLIEEVSNRIKVPDDTMYQIIRIIDNVDTKQLKIICGHAIRTMKNREYEKLDAARGTDIQWHIDSFE